jgi:hypothetical protein
MCRISIFFLDKIVCIYRKTILSFLMCVKYSLLCKEPVFKKIPPKSAGLKLKKYKTEDIRSIYRLNYEKYIYIYI